MKATGGASKAPQVEMQAAPHIDPAVAWQEMTTHNRILESRCLVLAQQLHEARAGNAELAAQVEKLTAALEAAETRKKG